MARKAAFITFEGVEGSGKSTQIERLAAALERLGRSVAVTREPGGTPTGENIRRLLLQPDGRISSRTELLLYAASRAELVAEIIKPALDAGKVVLCDRFTDSSLAYQGAGRGLDWDEIRLVNRVATEGLEPDLTIFLKIGAATGLSRVVGERDRIEREALAFHQRVAAGYERLAAEESRRIQIVDAEADPAAVHRQVLRAVLDFLGEPMAEARAAE